MRHLLRALGALALASLLVAACGSGGDGDGAVERHRYVSRPDLTPPAVEVVTSGPSSPGLLFLGPKETGSEEGPLIVDERGEPVWVSPERVGVMDFRAQTYRGEPVLTWWEGESDRGVGRGEFVIADRTYREVARFEAGNGFAGDLHELQLTDRGTALIIAYVPEPADLSEVGGPSEGYVLNSYVQEIDVETGEVVFEWNPADHVPVSDTFSELDDGEAGSTEASAFDWFHANSVAEDGDDTLLVSARNTHAVYAVDRGTGQLRWRLGGKSSDFAMDEGATFAWQHDARRLDDGTLSLFDNQADPPLAEESRAIVLALDESDRAATLVRSFEHPDELLAGSQGNAQTLDDGGVLVGWGPVGRVTEFGPDGDVVFDARTAPADSYRAYRLEWEGHPATRPDAAVRPGDDGELDVYASWNGATEVHEWRVVGGDDPERLEPLVTVPRQGFETETTVDVVDHVAVEALDASGRVLAESDVLRARA